MQTTLLGEKHWIFFFDMLDASELDHLFEEEMDNIWYEVI